MRTGIFSAIFLGFFALLTIALSGPATAQPYGAPYSDGRGGVQPLDRLLPGIRRAHPGNFYDAEGPTYGPSGDPHYHLKWMTPEGRVIWYDADARNGQVLRSSPGRDSFDNHRFENAAPQPGDGRPYGDRYPSSTADPYEPGYGREHNFGPGPGYARPYRDGDNRDGRGSRDDRGGSGWRH